MKKRAKRDQGVTLRALKILDAGGNTSDDIADELGISHWKAADCIGRLQKHGIVKPTERRIWRGGHRFYRVYEVVA